MKLKSIKSAVFILLFFAAGFMFAQTVAADTLTEIKEGVKNTGQQAGFHINDAGEPTTQFANAFIRYAAGMVTLMGALFMILVIYGGWLWMTAQGKEEQVERGKKIIIGAGIGLGVIIAARMIIEFAILNIPVAI